MKILYAGDSPAGGPANYLLGILRATDAEVTHIPPGKKLLPAALSKAFDGIILSDFSKKDLAPDAEKRIEEQVLCRAGLLMVGGWGSFSGPFGGWKGSLIENLLPVSCLNHDDRLNFPGGASLGFKLRHPVLKGLNAKASPSICGLNQIQPKKGSRVLLTARKIAYDGKKVQLSGAEYPLLVLHSELRTAAFATDFAPHWCGGLVDWGTKSRKLPVTGKIRIEIGESYLRFGSNLIRWLAGRA